MKFVEQILEAKGHDVWSTSPDSTVFDAVKLLSDKGIGSLVVMEDDKLVGIITERDYARKIILEGKSSRKTPVKDVMTKRVLVVGPERSVDDCMALMTKKQCRHLPVVQDERVVGVISIGDLVKAIIAEQQILIDQLLQYISG